MSSGFSQVRDQTLPNGRGVYVPRSRLLPVKSCSDLSSSRATENRMFSTTPAITLGYPTEKIAQCWKKFKDIVELHHLTVTGDAFLEQCHSTRDRDWCMIRGCI